MGKIISRTGQQTTAFEIVRIADEIAGTPGWNLELESTPEGSDFEGAPFVGRRRKDYERALAYLFEMQSRISTKAQVFLGGSCNPTTWRKDIAIPMLEAAGVAFYNPQMPDWKPEMMQWEADAKAQSYILLFVLDSQTRALAILCEIVEYIRAGRNVVLVVDYLEAGTEIDGQTVTEEEAEDINNARNYLVELAANALHCKVDENIEDAVKWCIAGMEDLQGNLYSHKDGLSVWPHE